LRKLRSLGKQQIQKYLLEEHYLQELLENEENEDYQQ